MSPNLRGLFQGLTSGFFLPFSPFKDSLLKELQVAQSQLHSSSGAMVKSFQFWCEYKNCVVTLQLFLLLFHIF